MSKTTIPQSIDSDFSAVNNFITEELRRVKQIRRYRSSKILKRNLLYIALFLISIGLLVFLLSFAYWFYKEKPGQIINIEGDETYNTTHYNLREDLNKLEQIIKDQKILNEQQNINSQEVKVEFYVFQSKNFQLDSDYSAIVHTGYKYQPDKIDFPDHYTYSDQEIENLIVKAKKNNAILLTTEKDYLRINENHKKNINFLKIKSEMKNKKQFVEEIKKKLWKF